MIWISSNVFFLQIKFQNYDAVDGDDEDMEKPEFSDLESDLEEELEVENWDEWEGPSKDNDDDEDSGKLECFIMKLKKNLI